MKMGSRLPFFLSAQAPCDNRVAVPVEPVESHTKNGTIMHTHAELTRRQIENILKNSPHVTETQARFYKNILKRMPC